ncbi:bifunctional UDP-N-acetylglucosamine diphosphorylase/glucosamine-1-phosphate N-acetyltransferase GlmU [Zavarzinia compransoris]|uniref:Bifunctional protein GlmU n=1 Tax=Zavarzinia compransoris TaxID=1264899 RepID=A0A317EA18_9PROT|nr:bifunctional UDP-N-acetylglucosamine diphosphorylase/glucosamine-1-phosphate N-acetyltransferase GlmU [Zavarzinia compransoris]PWR23096.1 bifunctional UDP-N-acetylglucosamine diphosphorylase/glucosamine-1-phosphate N-acetyltransferase GlmU [Zavarzinia compransoris]TDP46354.1 UDP-N-acetylglucosamine pyrophosphorylase /glucosamine-1-phosphate N-acetyltransferase [Zavarzinia compransoris]
MTVATPATAAVILAAGKGTRMRSALPKVLHPVADRPMIHHVVAAAREIGAERLVAVLSPGLGAVAQSLPGVAVAIQDPPLGTGHAVAAALPVLEGFAGGVLILFGDTPLIEAATLLRLRAALEAPGVAVAVLGFRPAVPGAYGRLVQDGAGHLTAIVEAAEATAGQLAIPLCNAGVMAIRAEHLAALVGAIGNGNAKGEYYLTDVVAIARARGLAAAVVEGAADEVLGVNSRLELAEAEAIFQARLRRRHMAAGVTFEDPASVRLSADTVLGRDVTVAPQVVFGPGVTVADEVRIHAFSHLEGAAVAAGAIVGPYARLRPGAVVGAGAHVGNFVELKNTVLGEGAKANHLSYLGDATVGPGANIGAGTITCNYDGFTKSKTEIGAGAFIGSNSALVAPVAVGAGAIVGAGSVVVEAVAADALYLERARPVQKPGWAARFRAAMRKSK